MQKKIIALAIASAISAPAFADNANVTIYGKAFLTFDQKSSDATGAASQMRVNTNATRFGVKGSEDLGDGLKGVYQLELEVDGDGSGNSVSTTTTTTTTTTETVAGAVPLALKSTSTSTSTSTPTPSGMGKMRNSGVGIDSDFGKVMLGVWDTPYKVAHNKIELFDNTTSWSSTTTIGQSAGKNYNTRQKNMIQYWSPKFVGVQAAVMYSPDEAAAAATTTGKAVNASILSTSLTYDQDDIYASVAYESRSDVGAKHTANTTQGTSDTALRAVGKYTLGDFWLGGMYESMKTNTSATASVSGSNLEVVGGMKMGANTLAASYATAGTTATTGFASNDVSLLSLKYGYNFSKRTELFAAYASQKTNGGTTAVPTSVTLSYVGGGIVHSF